MLAWAGGVRAQDARPDERDTLPTPRPIFFPRNRGGWVPVHVRLPNPTAERRTLSYTLGVPDQAESVRTRFEPEIDPGDVHEAVGYVWGMNQRWGGSRPPHAVRLYGPAGTRSPECSLLGSEAPGWQVAALIDTGPGGVGLPATVVARAPLSGMRPMRGFDAQAVVNGVRNGELETTESVQKALAEITCNVRVSGPGTLPRHVVGWDPADLLLVSTRAALDDLSLPERTAILQWVALGGVVLVDQGTPVSTAGRPLVAELLHGRPGTPVECTAASGADPQTDSVAVALAGSTVACAPPPPGFETLESWGDVPVLAWRPHGHGAVYYCGADVTRKRGAATPDLGPLVVRVLQHARDRYARNLEPLGDRFPGQPPGEPRFDDVDITTVLQQVRRGNTYWARGWRPWDAGATSEVADALHTGRRRMPSPWAVIVFLTAYVLALGPGVWWLRRRWGGGLVGIPIMLGVALAFALGAVGFGLATRGWRLVTQRVTYLWPVPGVPLAAESTWISCYAGLSQRVDVHFPGQVAPLTVDREGKFGTAGQLAVRFGTESSDALGIGLGAWQTRVLCAEGARAIGGVVTAQFQSAAGGGVVIENTTAMPLGRGALWEPASGAWRAVPGVPIGTPVRVDATLLPPGEQGRSTREYFDLPEPERWGGQGVLAGVLGAENVYDATGTPTGRPMVRTRVLYVAEVAADAVPGGGPTVPGETRQDDRVFLIVPVEGKRP